VIETIFGSNIFDHELLHEICTCTSSECVNLSVLVLIVVSLLLIICSNTWPITWQKMSGVVPSWQINHEAATSWPDVGRAESPMPSEPERANMRVHSMDVKCANFAK
jgi:hypothetical protein